MKEKLSLMIIFMIVFLGSQIGATENKTKGIEEMDNGDYTEMINRCIVGALKGKALEKDSEEMQAMQAYLQSLVK